MAVTIRPIDDRDLDELLELNNAHADQLSWLDRAGLAALVGPALYARRVDDVGAFLVALDQDAAYDSPNFAWFCRTYDRFAYVDRIVVEERRQGRGLARLLYEDLFACAATAGHVRVGCEVNERPPNPGSDAFHEALGFSAVGRAELPDRDRAVRYLVRRLERDS